MSKSNFFEGKYALSNFLSPGSTGFTPVVELPKSLNPMRREGVRIYIKLTNMLPLMNIKSLPSHSMLSSISKKRLRDINNLVEYSSGNTVFSLTVLARHFGIPRTSAVITSDVPLQKQKLLLLTGTDILISQGPACPDVGAREGGVYEAQILGKKKGWHNLHQYLNNANQRAAEEYIAKEVWKQFGGKLSVFMASIGTAGTVAGVAPYLLKKNPDMKVWGTCIKKGSSIPGPRSEDAVHKLAFPWQAHVHELVAMDAKSSFKASLDMIRSGLLVGPSSGMQLAAIIKKMKEYKKKGKLKNIKNKKGEINICFLGCDTMFPYIDDYFSVLPKKYFPKKKNLPKVIK